MSPDIPGPPRRLRRRPWIEAEFAALDFETTGLDLRRDAVVSFGVVPVRRGRVILAESVYREVAPAVPLTATSIVIHGIRPIDLRGAPAIAEARSELHAALDGRYVLAWAAEVEADFLATVFTGGPPTGYDGSWDVLRLAVFADRIDGSPRLSGDYALLRPRNGTACRSSGPITPLTTRSRPHSCSSCSRRGCPSTATGRPGDC